MHTYFLGLSLVGYDALWGRMIRSGVAGSVGSVKRTGTFPNGDVLRTSFTGISGFDRFLVPAVIFYNNILGNGSSADRMLLVSLFTTMQTVSHCMLVLGWDQGKRPPLAILEHLSWGVFNQAWGAAAVYPLYCFTHIERFLDDAHGSEKSDVGPTDVNEAFALVPTAVLGAITPAMLLYPAFSSSCTIGQRQGLIAFYRFTPLALAVAHPACCWAQRKLSTYLAWKPAPASAKACTMASLMFSGFASAAGHLWALLGPSEGGLRRVFWPAEYIDKASTTVIADGARDFLQWDIFVITAALVPFADQVLKSSVLLHQLRRRKWFSTVMDSFIGRMAVLTVASGIFSPGAVLAFSLGLKVAA
ncbi:zn 2cys6 transcription factor [Colletotrichum chrysophilum]|uniref:Zn 2cys6 transcription factor n=1 Tax=Colletotrichum chrysophilum TaxID=1836956 RepID=A0AAD9EKM9_9PEZI|nr:zn 2cys6 transcription factor [Colletotrichum chrysophilum]